MRDKIKNLFSKYSNINTETKTAYFYGVIFVLLLIFALIIKFTSNSNNNELDLDNPSNQEQNVETKVTNYEEVFSKITDNYEEDIVVYWYDLLSYTFDLDLLKKQKPLTGIHKKEFINIKKDQDKNLITSMDLKNLKMEEGTPNDIDITFITPENILKLMSSYTYKKDNKFMIETDSWLKLYNELTGKNIEKIVTGEIEITILSYENNELKLTLNLTNLYKNMNYSCSKVIYDMNFYNINNLDLSNENQE